MRAPFAAALAAMFSLPASAAVTLLGTGNLSGTATDQSGLTELLEDGVTPNDRIGGLGSAITYSGTGNLYYATPDRGPADGTTHYVDRIYTVRLALRTIAPYGTNSLEVTPAVVDTALMKNAKGEYLTGSAAAVDSTNSPASLRFDPEAIRTDACGKVAYVSDEYGPFLYRFNVKNGKRLSSVRLPNKLLVDIPSADGAAELGNNAFGRQSNRGMEGLAISPDGSKLYGLMQSALIQDGGLDSALKRVGTNNRLVEIDVATGAFREYLYTLDSKSNGVNEITAINDHEFLVIERDSNVGVAAVTKKIFKIDISGATDIRAVKTLPVTGVPDGVTAVAKSLFIDLLDPAFGIAQTVPEKIEGLAFGPVVSGHQTLVVTSDNDFVPENASRFWVFGIDSSDLPGYVAQQHACE